MFKKNKDLKFHIFILLAAVTGIRMTPIAVGSGHYKIRMDQRIAAALEKTAGASQKTSSS